MMKRILSASEEVLLVAFFLAAISVPLTVLCLRGEGIPARENRKLAELPHRPASLAETYHLPRMLSEYFKDHFGLRTELIRWQAEARVGWLKSSSSPEVILGTDGWLYYGDDEQISFYTGADPFTTEEMERWRQSFTSTREWLRARGVPFLVVFAPEKQSVYPENMPDSILRAPQTRQDQLLEYLRASSDLHVVDLRPTLHEAKSRAQLYYRTDTHWNAVGAFVAYQALARELGKDVRGIEPLHDTDFEVVEAQEYSGDLAGMLGVSHVFFEPAQEMRLLRTAARLTCDVRICVSEKPDVGLPGFVMFRDSFATGLVPFLAEHFRRGVYVWDENLTFSTSLVETERPDIVVFEMADRTLMRPPPKGTR